MITVVELRARIEAGKKAAMLKFERDWGTTDVAQVMDALRATIPTSTGPADAARRARRMIG